MLAKRKGGGKEIAFHRNNPNNVLRTKYTNQQVVES